MSLNARRNLNSSNQILSLQGLTLEQAMIDAQDDVCQCCGGHEGQTLDRGYWRYENNSSGEWREWIEVPHRVYNLRVEERGD